MPEFPIDACPAKHWALYVKSSSDTDHQLASEWDSRMDDLQSLEEWVAPLLEKLSPKERRKLARTIATALRRRQRERIADQRIPTAAPTNLASQKARLALSVGSRCS